MSTKTFITDGQYMEMQIQHLKPRYIQDKNKFEKCTTNAERINFFLHDEVELAHIKSKIRKIQPSLSKCDEAALKLRNTGNGYYRQGNIRGAVVFYNQSLAWAKTEEMASLAYANRSAAFFRLERYEECLLDIERAFKHGYPETQKPKLIKRKEDAEKAQKSSKKVVKSEETFEIPDSERNALIPSARNCIEIQKNDQYGRHVVATRDIKIGELLLAAEPYMAMIYGDRSTDPFCFCYKCLRHCYNLIPCPHCHQNLYCSELCKEEAFRNYHKYECLILPYLNDLIGPLAEVYLASLKVTFRAMDDENNDRTSGYQEIAKLESHVTEERSEKLYFLGLMWANVVTLVSEKTQIFKEFKGFEEKLKEQCFVNQQIVKTNGIEIDCACTDDQYTFAVKGLGLYPVYSFFNHSCYCNTFFYNCGSTMMVRALSTIKKGEQCFISYGPNVLSDDRTARQERLQRLYKFTCRCIACVENWPRMTYPKIYLGCNNNKEVKAKLVELIRKLENKTEKKVTPPSEEILSLRDVIIQAYRVLSEATE